MKFIVIGTLLLMYGTFHAIAIDRRIFKIGTRLALIGIVIMLLGRNAEAKHHGAVECKQPEKSVQTRVIPAVCEVVYK